MPSPLARSVAAFIVVLSMRTFVAHGQGAAAVPLEPIDAILAQFRSHRLVALGEGRHTNEQAHAFRLALIRDSRFAEAVDDIVVEFGNSRYQDLMDKFVRGEEVPDGVLRHVWQDTTQPTPIWDVPIYEEFFRAVWAVNSALAESRRLRVLLGDPPIDWDAIRTRTDMERWLSDRETSDRDRYAARVVQREVLAKGRRALIVYGDMHLQRRNLLVNFDTGDVNAHTLVNWLERLEPVFTVWTNTDVDLTTVQPSVATWRPPALTLLRGNALGQKDFTFYYPQQGPRFTIREGRPVPVPRDEWRSLSMQEQFDALMFLGPPSLITTSRLSVAVCDDPNYLPMRLARFALGPPLPPGVPNPADRLNALCGVTRR